LFEALKEIGARLFGNADAGIVHAEVQRGDMVVGTLPDVDRQKDRSLLSEFDCVAQ